MPDYSNGKIYRIRGGDESYIGSTIEKYISNRFGGHKRKYKQFKAGDERYLSSFILFDKYGVENCSVELIELFSCSSKAELHKREAFYIRSEICVNHNIPTRTDKEYKHDNKEKYKFQHKQYYNKHKEDLKKEAVEGYYSNREHILQRKSERFTCECGLEIRRGSIAVHKRTKKHLDKLNKSN